MNKEVLYDKYLGAFMGAAIGDALGWPNENKAKPINDSSSNRKFINWEKKGGGRNWPYSEPIKSGEYSDDTQLIFSVARSMLREDHWNQYFLRIELPAWIEYERGGGGATKKAAGKWANKICPWEKDRNSIKDWQDYFSAGGNGVAMRILPIVLYNIGDEDKIYKKILINGIGTHGHPRALVGALLYGKALEFFLLKNTTLDYGELIDYLLQTKDKWGALPDESISESWINNASQAMDLKFEWQKTVDECIKMMLIVKENISMGVLDFSTDTYQALGTKGPFKGSGTISAVTAIYIASKYAASPESGIIEAAFLFGADTDTIASMVGGLLGALHGTSWITSGWLEIQDIDYIKTLAKKMYLKTTEEDKTLYIPEISNTLKKQLKKGVDGGSVFFPIFRKMNIVECKDISTLKKNTILEYKLKTEIGQTVFVKVFSKNSLNMETEKSVMQQDQVLGINNTNFYNDKSVQNYKEGENWYLSDTQLTGLVKILNKSISAREFLNFISFYKGKIDSSDIDIDRLVFQLKNELGYKWLNKKIIEKIIEILN